MPLLFHPYCKSLPLLHDFLPQLENFTVCKTPTSKYNPSSSAAKTTPNCVRNLVFLGKDSILRNTHVSFCSNNEVIDELTSTHLPKEAENGVIELELLGKPSPVPVDDSSVTETEIDKPDKEDMLENFYKFFRKEESLEQSSDDEDVSEEVLLEREEEEVKKVSVEYYDPKPGDFVVGVVVAGNENKLDVNVGADLLGTMLTKEVLPLYDKELDFLLCDTEEDAAEFMVKGKMGIVRNEEALSGGSVAGRPLLEPGTVLFAEVLGRTLSGRPLLSTRRLFRRVAWQRVRQIQKLNEPIKVKITEWNTGGLLTRIEGLRAFIPKGELISRINKVIELKEKVGRWINMQIIRISEDTNDLILSEKEAWNTIHLKEGTLLEGKVTKIFPYGAQIRLGESNRSGLLHISNITRARVVSVSDLLAVDEKVKALVVKSMFPDRISLSTAELESEPGLFLSNKEKVFSEAEEMAKKYRQKLPSVSATQKLELKTDTLPFEDEENMYANWKWFKFERENEPK